MIPDVVTLCRLLRRLRLPLTDEKALQAQLADELSAAGIEFEREVKIAEGDVIDFIVGGIGIECKIKGSKRAIYFQCERYCQHDAIQQLILLTNVPTGFPSSINGRATFVVNLGLAWL